ncbi:type I restriction endonuclease subunit R [Desulfolutivibrio sulfoxidireducens]|uniref:type I restriction endonuclease subunit R n=1 Tax=Desulfolutivibrio sulfoxidireducens TaxID=2773299 RepID=UPI00159EA3F2|nr:HsdR family type I site-specific deoxyribonuclease [Desulfolutivibrio sulfoxidireducens]QLA20938.1 HsdR family type I site-specific deoxyribonuclease [Desulfolutivibrio sulfoxidireducens]
MPEYLNVEKPFLDQLSRLGWEVIDQGFADIPSDPAASCRTSFREVVLRDIFFRSVRAANTLPDGREWLTDKQLGDLYDELTIHPGKSLVEANRDVLRLLFKATADRNDITGEEYPEVRLIDFEAPEKNHFLAINQFRVDTPGGVKRFILPDIVLFVNGLPLVVAECKEPEANAANAMYEAYRQLRRYSDQREEAAAAGLREGEPRLFHCNQLLIRTCGLRADFGTITATDEHFFAWRHVPDGQEVPAPPAGHMPGTVREQETLVQGMLAPATLLDLVRNFTVFMDSESRIIKVMARYQQYRATKKIIERLRRGQTPRDRSGVVWHTQGSGKSLTMVFTIRALRRRDDLKDYKVVLVNDRTDLEEQLGKTAALTGETVTVIESTADLRRKLATTTSNLSLVMVHKFQEMRGSGLPDYMAHALDAPPVFAPFGLVNDSERILIMIDEAHRSQSGDMADNLFEAFPAATRIAFTGTPLLSGISREPTIRRFGDYIDKYKLQDAVTDGATVQILYEGKTAETAINERHEFDQKFEDLVADRTDEEILAIKKKYGTTGDILEAQSRIASIAADLVRHYIENILDNGFKAQVVTSSKLAAVRYQQAIEKALAEALEEQQASPEPDPERMARIAFLKTAVILSIDGVNERADVLHAVKSARERDAIANFKKPFDPANPLTGIAFLIVCDRLLTGFDAPIEQVMYLDKKVRDHNLLQTIARVNRVRRGKQRGYVVDYIGLANHLRTALSIYAGDDYDDAAASLRDISSEIPILESRYRRLLQFFATGGVEDMEAFVTQEIADPRANRDIAEQAVELLEDIKLRADFEVYLSKFLQSMDIVLPHAAANPYKIPAKRFGYILAQVRERYKDESLSLGGIGEKIKKLINEHLVGLGIDPKIPPVELLSPRFIEQVESRISDKAKASEMEHAIRKHCKIHFDKDPAFYAKLSEKLDALIKRHKDDWKKLCEGMGLLRKEARDGRKGDDASGLSPKNAPFYDLIGLLAFGPEGVPPAHAQAVKTLVADTIDELQQRIGIINFWSRPPDIGDLKGRLSDLVLYSGVPELIDTSELLVSRIVELAKARHQELVK